MTFLVDHGDAPAKAAPELSPLDKQYGEPRPIGSFNQLHPGQAELLAVLSEEAGEVVQAVGKILRHGYNSFHPHRSGGDNRNQLEKELGDVLCLIEKLTGARLMVQSATGGYTDLNAFHILAHCAAKHVALPQYLHHA